jgi:site-specific recombinase XerD
MSRVVQHLGEQSPRRRHSADKVPLISSCKQDTRAIQHYPGHRNIQHTTRYTELAADRFKDFWRD